ncbi:unknown protein [Desulfotalea psychrophila LSv54]|uniref:Uncharacterized protein n=1 Tax=Desulfotalea psychrophila (strain LSv54 / DSM 12343) TaxID=177439 RepID=Q6AN26_DESPS|nr:unknown protein [Desulfotalea psychrophila LSv54]
MHHSCLCPSYGSFKLCSLLQFALFLVSAIPLRFTAAIPLRFTAAIPLRFTAAFHRVLRSWVNAQASGASATFTTIHLGPYSPASSSSSALACKTVWPAHLACPRRRDENFLIRNFKSVPWLNIPILSPCEIPQ